MKNRWLYYGLLTAFLGVALFCFSSQAWAESELPSGRYYTIVDEKGKILDYTGLRVTVGDEFISPDDHHYRITKVEGYRAWARDLGKINLPCEPVKSTYLPSGISGLLNMVEGKITIAENKPIIGVYHTHDDESYTPTDGRDSIRGNGGIIKVGRSLVDSLKNMGLKVIHDETRHDPHDANAYHRSRRTAMRLLREGAGTLIDVHRDAAPPQAYNTRVEGKNVTKVKMVVGRSNPKMGANLDFAKRMKAHIDRDHPGLSAGIFIGKGNYNQDLTPRAMLIEVGADRNSRAQAEEAVRIFATSVPEVLGVTTAKTPAGPSGKETTGTLTATRQAESRNNSWVAIGAVVLLILAAAGYFAVNKGRVK